MNAIELSIGWFEGESLWNYLFGLTTLRFYVSHDAPWFIAALIPLYLLAPLLYRLIKAFQWKATILLIGVLYLTLTIPPMFNSEILNNVITNVQFVTIRATSFVLGMGLAQAIKNKTEVSIWWFVTLSFLGVVVVALTHHLVYGYIWFTLPLLFALSKLVEYCGKWVSVCTKFIGKISLESYLLNGFLPKVIITVFATYGIVSINNVIPYVAACLLGCSIGYLFHLLSDKLLGIVSNQRLR